MSSSVSLTWRRWIALLLAVPMAGVLSMSRSPTARTLLRRLVSPISVTRDDGVAASMAGPIAFGGFLVICHVALPWLRPPQVVMDAARQILHGLVLVGLFWVLIHMLDAVAVDIARATRPQRRAASHTRVSLAVRATKVALVGVAMAALLYELGYPVAAGLAGLGIGGLAVALPARNAIEKLMGARPSGAERPAVEATRASAPREGREVGLDALRGLAVFVMVGANMAPYMLDEPYPFWLRLYASLAAPAFILLAGFMVGHSHVRRPAPLSRHLKRALGLLLVATLVDVLLWDEDPFSTFDVLYLIALVLPASHLVLRLPRVAPLLVVAVIFLATPLLRLTVGYESEVADPTWARLQALFVDGWFPVFPWLGIGIVGASLGAFRQEHGLEVFARKVAMLGVLLLASGVLIWWLTAPELRTAGEFAELFYPPTLGVLFAMLGPVLCLLVLLAGPIESSIWRGFAVYGRVALAMYVLHLAVVAFVIKPWFEHEDLMTFVAAYFVHVLLLWWIAVAIRRLRPAPRSFWGRLLLGS